MTPKQQSILEALRRGKHIDNEITGWYWQHTKLRLPTQEALENTKELKEIRIAGKLLNMHWIVHESQVDAICTNLTAQGKIVLEVRPI